ncbi:hypothetical protein [Oleidesulfovibrio alaskensis]|jgi:hypothetical protein|uniref:hypothetical protein n=1 Tax=Oleidesulfovibrio alaskensis TaxID=58180 RepID=UPI001A62D2C7|nr:hypothetical protein [Oleidesulfovibrio alaskensis]MBL3582409.1 hypothetical protein [Oleidesulfovibrio alaskensis]
MRNVIWWLVYTAAAIWAQKLVPGIDFLLPGLIIALQEERPIQTFWIIICFSLIQEGSGTMSFGPAVGQYLGAAVLVQAGRWLFEARNISFVLLLSAGLGLTHFGMISVMAMLQDISLIQSRLMHESIIQALVIPPCWLLVMQARKRFAPDESPA